MPGRGVLRAAAFAASVAIVSSGCAVVGAGDGDGVRVYSGRHYGVEEAFDEFASETGVDVEFLFGGDAELRERISTEGEETLADVYVTVDAANLHLAAEQGLLRPVESKVLEEAIPDHLQDPRNRWFALSVRARTIVYHPDRVDPSELSTYEALTDPRWEGRVCLRNSTNVYTQSLVASLIAHHGYERAAEIVRGWVENDPVMINNDVEMIHTVAEGGCDLAVVNHYYLGRLLAEDPDLPVEVFWANQGGRGTHVNISGAGVTEHADDPEAAVRFLEWLATEGQQAFIRGNHEFPANPDAEPTDVVRGFGDFQADELDAAEIGALNADAVRLMDEVGYE